MEKEKLKFSPSFCERDDGPNDAKKPKKITEKKKAPVFFESPIKLDSASSVSHFDMPQNVSMLGEELFQRRNTIQAVYSGRRKHEEKSGNEDLELVLQKITSDQSSNVESCLQHYSPEEILEAMKRHESFKQCDQVYRCLVRKQFPDWKFTSDNLNWKRTFENLVHERNMSKLQKESDESLRLETLKAKINSKLKKTNKRIKKAKFMIVEEMGDPEKKATRKRKL